MKVKDLMSRHPVTAHPDASFDKVWQLIFEKKVSGIPIVEKQNTLIGIISEEDLLEKLYPSYEDYLLDSVFARDFETMEERIEDVSRLKAGAFMNRNVYTTTEDAPIMKAASSMLIYHVSCLPVVRERRERKILVGIICKGDIFSHLFRMKMVKLKQEKQK